MLLFAPNINIILIVFLPLSLTQASTGFVGKFDVAPGCGGIGIGIDRRNKHKRYCHCHPRRVPPRQNQKCKIPTTSSEEGQRQYSISHHHHPSLSSIQTHSRNGNGRRSFLARIVASSSSSYHVIMTAAWSLPPSLLMAPSASCAFPLLFTNQRSERRQLELCLVAVLRTEHWATSIATLLKTQLLSTAISGGNGIDNDPRQQQEPPSQYEITTDVQKKSSYLEARLGAKALLTQKIGGGANSRVRILGGFQLKECLDDAKYWCREYYSQTQSTSTTLNNKNSVKQTCSIDLSNAIDDLIDSLASIVEFDGLETTIDPSPRSSLMLSMYNQQKGDFVYRTLMERVVPSCERILNVFGRDRRRVVEQFVRDNNY